MGTNRSEPPLFAFHVNLERRVSARNPLRAVAEVVDFRFVRQEVAELYGKNGNVSVDPEIILKLMFLLFFDNVSSERALMEIVPERLDYLWFLGLNLDDEVPDHSVLSKARARWGSELFSRFFTRTVAQACEAGLVDGSKLYVDSSLVDANASAQRNLSGEQREEFLNELYARQARKLSEQPVETPPSGPRALDHPVQSSADPLNTTDPDAPLIGRRGTGKARPRYKNHRAVDPAVGIITAIRDTGADVDDATQLLPLIEQSEAVTEIHVQSACADSHYGTHDNYRHLSGRSTRAFIRARRSSRIHNAARTNAAGEPMFTPADFRYDPVEDRYTCPADKHLHRTGWWEQRKAWTYYARRKDCKECPLRSRCTTSATAPRKVLRHLQQEVIDEATREQDSPAMHRELSRRMTLAEGSFADAALNHGMKRARWRSLHRVQIQSCLIAAVQNIRKLIRHRRKPTPVATSASMNNIIAMPVQITPSTPQKAAQKSIFHRFISSPLTYMPLERLILIRCP